MRISMTVSALSAQEGDTAVPHPSTGLFSRKTLPIALQTSDLGVFLAETLPDRRTQGLCARTFAQNVLEKRVTMPHRARFRLKRARMRGRGAETRAFPIKMRAEYGLPGNSLIARRAAGSKSNSGSGKGQQQKQQKQQRKQGKQRKQGRQGNAGREKGARRARGRQIFPCPFTERNFYYICIITRLRADAHACQSTDGRVQTAK